MELMTNSRRSTFRTCKRLHQLTYEQCLRPVKRPDYFSFGTLVHSGVEAWWRQYRDGGDNLGAMDSAAMDAISGHVEERDPVLHATASAVVANYHKQWPDYQDWAVLAIERKFVAPMFNPQTMKASRTWELGGKIDLVLRHKPTDKVHLVEHKTTTDSFAEDSSHYWLKLAMDSQLTQYVIGVESLGFTIDFVTYDVMRRPQHQPKPATPEDQLKYCKSGPREGQLHARMRLEPEPLGEFAQRMMEMVTDDEAHHFFRRRKFARMDSELMAGMGDAWDEGKEMREAQLNGRHPRNPDACLRFGTCGFYQVCALGIDPHQSMQYETLDDPNPELKGLE